MRFLIRSRGLLLLTLMVAGCNYRTIDCAHDATLRTYQQWKESVKFPYIAPRARQEQIANNIEKLGVGSTKEEFVGVLGGPDYEEEMNPKEPNRPCIGYGFTYYFEKPEDVANEKRTRECRPSFLQKEMPPGLLATSAASGRRAAQRKSKISELMLFLHRRLLVGVWILIPYVPKPTFDRILLDKLNLDCETGSALDSATTSGNNFWQQPLVGTYPGRPSDGPVSSVFRKT